MQNYNNNYKRINHFNKHYRMPWRKIELVVTPRRRYTRLLRSLIHAEDPVPVTHVE